MAYVCVYTQTPGPDPQSPVINVFTVDPKRIGFKQPDTEMVLAGKETYATHIIELDPEQDWMVTIDQSTSSTGIAITSRDFSSVIVMTVVCDSASPYAKEPFVEMVKEMLLNMLRNLNLIFVGLEEVPPNKGGRRTATFRVLLELKSNIKRTLLSLPQVAALQRQKLLFEIFPSSWKSTVYDKKTGASHFNDKELIALDICKMFPNLREYFNEMKKLVNHDYDGFDAFGLLVHVRLKHYDPDWQQRNLTIRTQLGKYFVFLKYIEMTEEELNNFASPFLLWYQCPDSEQPGEFLELVTQRTWNDDRSIYENLTMAANTNMIVWMTCENPMLVLSYLIETGQTYDSNKALWLVVSKCNNTLIGEQHVKEIEAHGFYTKRYYKTYAGNDDE